MAPIIATAGGRSTPGAVTEPSGFVYCVADPGVFDVSIMPALPRANPDIPTMTTIGDTAPATPAEPG